MNMHGWMTSDQVCGLAKNLANTPNPPNDRVWISPCSLGGRTLRTRPGVSPAIMRGKAPYDLWYGYSPNDLTRVEFRSSADPETITLVHHEPGVWKAVYDGDADGPYAQLFREKATTSRPGRDRPEPMTQRIGDAR